MENLTTGLSHSSQFTVTEQLTAQAMGSGDMPVLATPAMIALMENAAMTAVAPTLPDGDTTVGTMMDCTHDRASAIGTVITATATLTAVNGRALTFSVEAQDDAGNIIGKGTHTRFIVTRERFLAKLK